MCLYFETVVEIKSPVSDQKLYLNDYKKPSFYITLLSYPDISGIVISHNGQSMNNLSSTKLSTMKHNLYTNFLYVITFEFLSTPSTSDIGEYLLNFTYDGVEKSQLFGRLIKLGKFYCLRYFSLNLSLTKFGFSSQKSNANVL